MSRTGTGQGEMLIFPLPYIIIEVADWHFICRSAGNRIPEQTSKEQKSDDRI